MGMVINLSLLVVLMFVKFGESTNADPRVQVYTRVPGEFGKENTLICHASGFYPPEIRIELLKNGKVMTNTMQTDLAFDREWAYHLTRHAKIIPEAKDHFTCRVTHLGNTKTYEWEKDM